MKEFIDIIKKHWGFFTLVTLAAITLLSLWPAEKLPSVPGTDKSHHFIAYALLMLPAALRRPRYWIAYGFIFVAWSGAIELIQPYVNRYGEWMDMAANATGVICGVILASVINLVISNKSPSADVK